MFAVCNALPSIELPDGVTSIEDEAFFSCASLESVALPDSLTSIGDSAFLFCDALINLTLPDGVLSIGDGAFSGCSRLTLTVARDSYAAQYARENDVPYTYPDANDWLND